MMWSESIWPVACLFQPEMSLKKHKRGEKKIGKQTNADKQMVY